jgi:hypothetical protein
MKLLNGRVLALLSFFLLATAGHAQEWTELTPVSGDAPAPRRNAASIYDPAGHRMIIFSGRAADSQFLNDVWAFDFNSNAWADLTPSSGPQPAPRYTANAIYDAESHQMIIWSGQGSSFLNDVWAFNLNANTWSEFNPLDPKPNIRYGTAAIFDPVARDLVTFAGFTNQGRFDDTWRFDIDNVIWTNVTSGGSNPPMRCLHSACYDSFNHRMIIYGGQQSGALEDIWALDLNNDSWANLTPATRPSGRWFPSNIYDAQNHRVVIFAGNLGTGNRTNEVWQFDLMTNSWQQFSTSGTPPAEREGAAAIYIQTEDRMVIFGGRTNPEENDVWALNNLSGALSSVEHATSQVEVPNRIRLLGNFPNPFNPETTIHFEVPETVRFKLSVCDLRGRIVKELAEGNLPTGIFKVSWDGTDDSGLKVPSGVYLVVLNAGDKILSKKAAVLR